MCAVEGAFEVTDETFEPMEDALKERFATTGTWCFLRFEIAVGSTHG